jgi:hypothetical protein
MNIKQKLILKLGGYIRSSSCPICGFESDEKYVNDSPFKQGHHNNLKLRQVGDEKIGLLSTSYPLSDEQFYHIKKSLSDNFPGFKILVLECLDAEVGAIAQHKITEIHNAIHKFLEE